jgi:hypothetical protein
MAEPAPEQTASWASMMMFSFLDPTVALAYRVPHLSFDQLPPLADYDEAHNLVKRSFPVRVFLRCAICAVSYPSCTSIWTRSLGRSEDTCSGA